MTKEQKIIVTAFPNGTSKIEAVGFTDGACLKETKSLEEALGKVTSQSK